MYSSIYCVQVVCMCIYCGQLIDDSFPNQCARISTTRCTQFYGALLLAVRSAVRLTRSHLNLIAYHIAFCLRSTDSPMPSNSPILSPWLPFSSSFCWLFRCSTSRSPTANREATYTRNEICQITVAQMAGSTAAKDRKRSAEWWWIMPIHCTASENFCNVT